jgi:hypothetical protein
MRGPANADCTEDEIMAKVRTGYRRMTRYA